MGCLIALFALFSPRLALFFVWIFSNVLSRAFDSWVLPLLGFFLLPWTTLFYAWMWDVSSHGVNGFEWFLVGLAFLFDLASYTSRDRYRRARADPAYPPLPPRPGQPAPQERLGVDRLAAHLPGAAPDLEVQVRPGGVAR